ncbi:MbtH family protein [Saccharopolyspora cebuensis]|uniref:MbtH family protein n=1 Tax=Saccharopolyspora cebuensis TaxID=418759 RepID=A0ABV4CM78_9PSEU
MTNPFENPEGRYFVLINQEEQYSLWPEFTDIPRGWSVVFGQDHKQKCLDYISENWTDMRPKSHVVAMRP